VVVPVGGAAEEAVHKTMETDGHSNVDHLGLDVIR